MRRTLAMIGLSAGILGSAITVGCGEDFTCEEAANCGDGTGGADGGGTAGTGATSGTSGVGGSGGDGGSCDESKSPSEEPCLVSDQYAIFVSPDGSANGAGTMADPVGTMSKALELASAGPGRIIVCNATYDESVTVGSSADGISIHGGFKCPGAADAWTPEAKRPLFAPSAQGYALLLENLTIGAVIEDVEFVAQPGKAPGESSIAAFANSAQNVTLRRVRLEAKAGMKGADGTTTSYTFPTAGELKGTDGAGTAGGEKCTVTCPDGGSSIGGRGGDMGQGGAIGQPNLGGGSGGQFGQACAGPGTGGNGKSPSPAGPGDGASSIGTLDSNGWSGTAGGSGQAGAPGQGGGGGAGDGSNGGGSGSCGGCGGGPGSGGEAGGSSIALTSFSSNVVIDSSTLVAANGGNGGNGAQGQQGQAPGAKGNGAVNACSGGVGAKGSDGGPGGGGAGGLSAGVVWQSGSEPTLTDSTPTIGNPGAAGAGGPGGNAGVPGEAKAVIAL